MATLRKLDGTMRIKMVISTEYKIRFFFFKGLIWLACWLAASILGCKLEYKATIGDEHNAHT